ncbi:MAG: glycosyltransferase family 4 protein [Arachnia sp.]
MRVALLCPYSLDTPGGVATHVLGLASWLVLQGDEVSVIAPGTRAPSVRGGVAVHLVGRATSLPFNGSVAQLALRRRQRAEAVRFVQGADVVHVHEPLTPGIAYAVARRARTLVVTHHASFTPSTVLSAFLRRRAGALSPRASIAVSHAAQSTAFAATGEHPVIIANGVLMPDPPPVRSLWRGGVRPRIGFLGRLDEPRKGFAVFREVAELARAAGLDADFVALGPGTPHPGHVRLLGALENRGRNLALQHVDVLLAPNLFGESFGLILVEALAAGCSVVASDLPGFEDVLKASGTGRTFPRGDAASALAAIQSTLESPEDPRTLHASATQWGWDVLGARVRSQYTVAIGAP